MKGIRIKIIALIPVALALWSCSEDILDKKPLNGYREVGVFADAALLDDFVKGTYRGLRHPFDNENSLTDGLTDNAYNQHGSAEGTIKIYTRGEVNENNGEGITRSLWSTAYTYIRRTNLFFDKVGSSEIDEAELALLEGQMHFLRAYFYFDLLRWYGGVPLLTANFELDNESFDMSRSSAADIGEFITSECDLAISQLYSISDSEYETGRASAEAAMSLKARTLLYLASPLFNESNDRSKWIAARDANEAVMNLTNLSLVEDTAAYGKMFRGENSDEVILARYFTQATSQGQGVNTWLFPNSLGGWSNTTPTQDLVDEYELTNGLLPSDPASGYDDQDPYVNRDPRFYKSILYNGAPFKDGTYDYYVDKNDPSNPGLAGKDSPSSSTAPWNASRTGYTFRKWTQEAANWDSGNLGPWIIFRLGEFYLNYAEAQIALGAESEARAALNEIRSRVGMPDITESGPELLDRYRRERRIELVLEDHHFFDMRRWKMGEEMLDKAATGVKVYKDGTTIEYVYDVVTDNTRQWDDKMYLLPIPVSEIQSSHEKLIQNPGY